MNNLEKAHKMAEHDFAETYGGDVDWFEDENGKMEIVIERMYIWLEDGNAEGCDVQLSLSLWTLE